VLSTATFVGFVVAGTTGAFVATVAIFLPSFVFVLILNTFIPRLRSSKTMSAFLDALNANTIGLMAAVVIQLARAAVVDWRGLLIAGVALVVRDPLQTLRCLAGGRR
jgi:chromate transporter